MIYVTDTHPLVWLLEDNPRLSIPARDALHDPLATIVVPALVLAEVGYLYARNRIPVDVPAVLRHVHGAANCQICPIDEAVIAHLPAALDIHDAIIVATAIMYRDDRGETVALITRDAAIHASGLVSVVW